MLAPSDAARDDGMEAANALLQCAGIGKRHRRRDDVQQATWTPEEDLLLIETVQQTGCYWKRVATLFPSRTVHSVRNRHLRLVRGTEARRAGVAKNRCSKCGQLARGHVCLLKLTADAAGPMPAPTSA